MRVGEADSTIPEIDPVPAGFARPLWSVMIPNYNSDRYLEETLRGVLAQDPGPDVMQIEVVDDCSTQGDPETLVKEVGNGRVSYYRQSCNVGPTRNFNDCVRRSVGHWLHILHSDDVVLPGYYAKYEQLISEHPDVIMVVGPVVFIDEHGKRKGVEQQLATTEGPLRDFRLRQATWQMAQAPSVVVKRAVYEEVGAFQERYSHVADFDMWFRASGCGTVVCTQAPYALYRQHSNSDTSKLVLSARQMCETPTPM
jgi:GT2 family glycosyltransferase